MSPTKKDAEPDAPVFDDQTMARAEDGGLSRVRVEDGGTPDGDEVVLVNPERSAE